MKFTPTEFKRLKAGCTLAAIFVLGIISIIYGREAVLLIIDKWGAVFAWWSSLPSCDRPAALWGIFILYAPLVVGAVIIIWLCHKTIEYVRIAYLDLDGKAS